MDGEAENQSILSEKAPWGLGLCHFPGRPQCLCQLLEVLSLSPSAQSYSGGSAPACWGRGTVNIMKIIWEVFYKPLCIWCVRLGGRGAAWVTPLQGDTSQSVLGFVTEEGRLWILLCTVVLPPGVTPEDHWKFPLGMLLKGGKTTTTTVFFLRKACWHLSLAQEWRDGQPCTLLAFCLGGISTC